MNIEIKNIEETFVSLLNDALLLDPSVISSLIGIRRSCSKSFAEHPHIQVFAHDDNYWVGLLGILNGILGELGSNNFLFARVDVHGNVTDFYIADNQEDLEICPVCETKFQKECI